MHHVTVKVPSAAITVERVTVKKEMIGETSTKEKWELTMRAAERQKAAPLELDSEYSS